MKFLFSALCAGFLLLTGCTGQAEPAVVVSEAASPSAVESSNVPESPSEPDPSSEPESSDAEEAVSEPAASSAAESSSAVLSAQATSNAAEPASMPPSSSEPVVSSAAEVPKKTEPLSSEPDKIPPGEPVESLTPPAPLTPEQEEEERMMREEIRLTERAFALASQVEEILPPDILGGEVGVYQRPAIEVQIPVVDQAAASEILEPYVDPEISFSYCIVELSKSEIEAIAAGLWEQEIIRKYKDEIDIVPSYWGSSYMIAICADDPIPELDAWLEGYTGAANIKTRYLSNGNGKVNPA